MSSAALRTDRSAGRARRAPADDAVHALRAPWSERPPLAARVDDAVRRLGPMAQIAMQTTEALAGTSVTLGRALMTPSLAPVASRRRRGAWGELRQRGAAATQLLRPRAGQLARREWRNKVEIYRLVRGVRALLALPA
ncbi:MAG: hypothetical protein AAF772_17585, partial [Acidobacteriota bacterium]